MRVRTIGGWALLTNALLTLFISIWTLAAGGGDGLAVVTGEALSLLLIVGLPAIWAMQPQSGRLGQIGLWCLGIATSIAFLVRLVVLFSTIDVGDAVPFVSALFGLVGSLLVGWATIRAKVFHPAVGWLLMLGGALNLLGGLLPAGAGATLVGALATLAQVGALGGYGWTMLRSTTLVQHASVQQR